MTDRPVTLNDKTIKQFPLAGGEKISLGREKEADIVINYAAISRLKSRRALKEISMADWSIILNDKIIKQFSLADGEKISIGRGKEADIVIDNAAISRKHIAIESTAGIYLISDLGSTNGTYVNGKKIDTNEPVSDSDLIEFGKFRLLPTSKTNTSAKVADSVAAATMDLDEATVFVTSSKIEPEISKRSFKPRNKRTRLTLVSGSASPREFEIEDKTSIKIGKDSSCDIVIPGFLVAKAQCYIFKKENKFMLVPQKSWAGTFVNDSKITTEKVLHKGDIIRIRSTSLRFDK